jgi:hypothetical protein
MGYYINLPESKGKLQQIQSRFEGAEALQHKPKSFSEVPEGRALICVVDNGPFEAAAFVYSEDEFHVTADPRDVRPKYWVLIDLEDAINATGYKG